ncbi:LuxR C-terminal-related transcriptional regulator [Kribbella sp. NPDC026596]|uniref:LuxR C-terminal-related transcriptional regulator n=1 Tax=Kribbella sp. NPDC026596 TaxID=3155122 RepID=UPI0033C34579
MAVVISPLERGRLALRVGDGVAAREAFAAALAERRSGEALEGLGKAAYLLVDLDEVMERWHDAYVEYRAAGLGAAAARVARVVASVHGTYAGDWAVASGWIARAKDLLAGQDASDEVGWVALTSGMFEGDRKRKHALLEQALHVAGEVGDLDLRFAAEAYYGASLVHDGRVEEGMLRLDEALAAVVGGEVDDQIVIEEIFCQMFAACEHAHDLVRADQWMRVGDQVAQRRSLPGVAAYCNTHFGGLLTAAGRWPEAEEALTEGIRLWALGKRTLRNGALARLAELRVRQGRLAEAAQLLAELPLTDETARPLAALQLGEGRADEAQETLERCLTGMTLGGVETVPLLALLVDAQLAAGDPEGARRTVGMLEACLGPRSSSFVRATIALARGRLALASREEDPRPSLREALDGFIHAQYPLETALCRLQLALASTENRPDVAVAEARAAYDAFERLRAARHVDAAAALLRTLGVKVASAPADGGLLTRREAEVLELVGQGLSNPEIAGRLFISRKTVEHHVGNVFAKLGLRSRSQAAAYAAREKQGAG